MAYGRRKGAKRPAKGGKGVSRLLKKPTTAITTLAKAVKSIQRKMKAKTIMLNYGFKQDYQLLSGNLDIFPLTNYSAWSPIFGASANDSEANKAIHKSMGIDMYFNSQSETDPINFTVMIVSLKDACNGFNAGTGALSLVENLDYHQMDALTMINKKNYNIHFLKRFTLGNNGVGLGSSTAQTQYGTDRRFYAKISCNKTVENSRGDWRMVCSPDPSDNYFLLVFNDNGILDATYPRLRYNVVHTVEQLA
jgi:hypothetical protein